MKILICILISKKNLNKDLFFFWEFLFLNFHIFYTSFRSLEEAADIAFQQRDIQGLLYVQSKCSTQFSQTQLGEKINNMITQLESKK